MKLNIPSNTLRFYKDIFNDPHHRYRSWEHCYRHFQGHETFRAESDFDIASLHLAFFLASWGMYRGSAPILQKDYQIHVPVVKVLTSNKYLRLWNMNFKAITADGADIDLVFDLVNKLEQAYRASGIAPSRTLITKVLLGTICCVPAYDRFFCDGVKVLGEFPASFGRKSYAGLIKFCQQNWDEFREVQTTMPQREVKYPMMKLLDMYFWSLGN